MENEKQKEKKEEPCPLCGTMLLYDKWLRVVGVYEEQQKHRKKQTTKRLIQLKLSVTLFNNPIFSGNVI